MSEQNVTQHVQPVNQTQSFAGKPDLSEVMWLKNTETSKSAVVASVVGEGISASVSQAPVRKDIELFAKNAWFFAFFFGLLLLIASFGIIAES